jgi:tetratricopeptide (TPR) repeat protein
MQRKLATCVLIGSMAAALVGCGGCKESSSETKSTQQDIADALKLAPPQQARQLVRIARSQARGFDTEGARSTLNLAFKACTNIEEHNDRASGFATLALAQTDMNYSADARSSAKSSLEAAEKVEEPGLKATAYAASGRALAAAGDTDRAVETLKKAEELAKALDDVIGRVQVLCLTAAGYERMAKGAEADRVLAETLTWAGTLDNAKTQAIVMGYVAQQQSALKRDAAPKTFDAALVVARNASDPGDKVIALLDIAEMVSKSGNAKLAHQLLVEGEQACAQIKAPDQQSQLLDRSRNLMSKLPKPAA